MMYRKAKIDNLVIPFMQIEKLNKYAQDAINQWMLENDIPRIIPIQDEGCIIIDGVNYFHYLQWLNSLKEDNNG